MRARGQQALNNDPDPPFDSPSSELLGFRSSEVQGEGAEVRNSWSPSAFARPPADMSPDRITITGDDYGGRLSRLVPGSVLPPEREPVAPRS